MNNLYNYFFLNLRLHNYNYNEYQDYIKNSLHIFRLHKRDHNKFNVF